MSSNNLYTKNQEFIKSKLQSIPKGIFSTYKNGVDYIFDPPNFDTTDVISTNTNPSVSKYRFEIPPKGGESVKVKDILFPFSLLDKDGTEKTAILKIRFFASKHTNADPIFEEEINKFNERLRNKEHALNDITYRKYLLNVQGGRRTRRRHHVKRKKSTRKH
jgi:hypothetical protein